MSAVFDEVVDALLDLKEDEDVPKSVLKKVDLLLTLIKSKEEYPIIANKSLSELDDILEDSNIPQHVRTQIWHISSLLETI